MTRLWQILLGTLIISSLACGGPSPSSDGGRDGGGTSLDAPAPFTDLALPAVDQAAPAIDQAPAAIDQAPALDVGTVKRDTANADVAVSDTLAPPDVPTQPDLTPMPDLFVKRDLGPDLPLPQDLAPGPDLPQDLPPAVDLAIDTSRPDTRPAPDTGIDTGAVDTTPDTTPKVAPNKLTYVGGEQLTATYSNGSSDPNAWIGIYPVGGANGAYRDYDYTGGATSGTVILHVPATPGTYELRMFKDIGYVPLATSVPFTVQ
jgi:hypothetical protein